jgi:hypothetical protein
LSDTLEHTARRIAERGREALVARLRPAFEEAAAAHGDVLKLDHEQLEQMVQRAADRADGLQWRRALASVASEDLGIGLGEALSHPAVVRAQAIVGAPSYEESLAALPDAPRVAEPAEHVEPDEPAETPSTESGEEPGAQAEAELEPDSDEQPLVAEGAPIGHAAPITEEQPVTAAEASPEDVRLTAVHLGGIANLAPAESDLELRFSDDGLDIIRPAGDIFGRLTWDEITGLDVPDPRGLRKRRRPQSAHLVVRSERGDASFEVPGVTSEELRAQLDVLELG